MKLFFSNHSGPDGELYIIYEREGGKEIGRLTDLKAAEAIVHCFDQHQTAIFVIRNILHKLPTNKDWLDPDIEALAKYCLQTIK